MSNIIFHRLIASDRDLYNYYYKKSNTRLADMTFNCRIAWDEVFKSEIAVFEECCILISDGGCFTDPHILMPMGELDSDRLDRILLAVRKEFDRRGWKLKIMCIDEDKLPLFENLPHFEADLYYNDDSSDYLYDGESMRTLAGNVLHKKRNHVNKFIRMYPDFEYSSLTCKEKDECLALVAAWCKSRDIEPDNCAESDYNMIRRLFEDCSQLELHGGLIRTGGIVRAFSIGSLGNANTAYIHFEKADQEIHGIYSAINQMVLQNEFPTVDAVDREEDMGLSGLRKAKQSYEPISLLRKYKTWITDK